ncbi:MAG: thioredoxin [Bacteroidales bacterium]|nr:thioredoxin [Bacteroidales bacterium]
MKKKLFILTLITIFTLGFSLSSCNDKNKEKDGKDLVENVENADQNNTDNIVDNNVVTDNTNNTDVVDNTNKIPSPTDGKVHMITSEEFKNNIFDYMNNEEWNYQGSLPCIVDFYADWCGPCKMVAPIMDELAEEYKGKVAFYKVDVDNEGEVANVFGIQSIPSVLFVPASGEPQMSVGAMEKEGYVNAIEQVLQVK